MAEKDAKNVNDLLDEQLEGMEDIEEESIVVMTDDEGHEVYYHEEMVIPVDGSNFAILVGFDPEAEDHCGCGCDCSDPEHHHEDDEEMVIIAKIEFGEDGQETYVAPTDEEFEKVREAYEELFDEEEE